MNRKTELERFLNAIAGMAATFRQEATEALFHGYRIGLEDLPIEAIEAAVARALRDCKFMPSAAELRELAGELTPEHRAVVAWGAFVRAVRQHDYYHSIDFDDPLVNATVHNLGGWEVVSTVEDRNEFHIWLRKRFEQTYVALYNAGVTAEQAAPLMGYHERNNRQEGYFDAVKPPVRIGCDLPALPSGKVRPALPAGARVDVPLLESVGAMPDEG